MMDEIISEICDFHERRKYKSQPNKIKIINLSLRKLIYTCIDMYI